MIISDFEMFRLSSPTDLTRFDCGNKDLNDFLRDDALNYTEQLLAVTRLFKKDGEIVAFFSVANDKIKYDPETFESRAQYYKVLKAIPQEKLSISSYPAVKIARLGVCNELRRKSIGSQIIDWVKFSFTTKNKTGCRFITVDANNNAEAINFYLKNGFKFMTKLDERNDNRLMYFDLIRFVNAKKSKD